MRLLFRSIKTLTVLAKQSIVVSLLLYVSVCVSLLAYVLFYNWYMPKASWDRSLAFHMHTIVNKDAGVWRSELTTDVFIFDDPSESFVLGQEYALTLNMDVAESDLNFEIGMFGISVDVLDLDGRLSSSFHAIGTMNYKSKLLRYLTTLIYLPFYVLGYFEQRQAIKLVLKDDFFDNPFLPAHRLVIRINERIQIYSAKLLFRAKFTGLRYLLHHWYLPTSIFICLFLTSFVFALMLISHYDLKSLLKMDADPFGTVAARTDSFSSNKNYTPSTRTPATSGVKEIVAKADNSLANEPDGDSGAVVSSSSSSSSTIAANRARAAVGNFEDDFGFMDETINSETAADDDGDIGDSAFSRDNSIMSSKNLLYRSVELGQ